MIERVPGRGGSQGPFPDEYNVPHVYARDIHSGSGNCVCGTHMTYDIHTEIAPGVPMLKRFGLIWRPKPTSRRWVHRMSRADRTYAGTAEFREVWVPSGEGGD